MQKYFIRYNAPTFKTITLSFDVTNFQTISKRKNSNPTYVYVLSKNCEKSLNRQTKKFVTKRFQNLPNFPNLAINSPIWQPCSQCVHVGKPRATNRSRVNAVRIRQQCSVKWVNVFSRSSLSPTEKSKIFSGVF